MGVLQKIEEDLKNAMKARATLRLSVLRLIKTAVKNKEIELIRQLSDQEFIAVLSSMVKQRRDSAEQYAKAGRAEASQQENDEIVILAEYLPKALDAAELDGMIAVAIAKAGAVGAQDMGKVMKELKEPTAGRVDGKVLADKVRAALQK